MLTKIGTSMIMDGITQPIIGTTVHHQMEQNPDLPLGFLIGLNLVLTIALEWKAKRTPSKLVLMVIPATTDIIIPLHGVLNLAAGWTHASATKLI
jgi:hypothetical protein